MEQATRTMIMALRRGQCVAIFPEGTTSDGSALLPFHPGLFQPAIDSESTVWPVAIRYVQEDGSQHRDAAFVGELSLVASVWRILRAVPIRLIIHYDEPLFNPVRDRRLLADSTYRTIASLLPTTPSHFSPHGLPYVPAGSVLS
jgi:1-acyl-sn-glycerol-3-phosphate acyltransferase